MRALVSTDCGIARGSGVGVLRHCRGSGATRVSYEMEVLLMMVVVVVVVVFMFLLG